jgi:ABC-type glycerol-3-phosphate transport system permease component
VSERRPPLALFLLAVALALSAMLPIWWAAISALRPSEEVFRYLSPISVWSLWPRHVTLANVHALLTGSFMRALCNSMLVTSLTLLIGLPLCASAGFAFTALRFPGRSVLFAIMVVGFLVPFDSVSLPLLQMFQVAGLQNSYVGLLLPALGNGLAMFLFRQFFLTVPDELREAAMIDGLGWFGIFVRIYLPLSKRAIIAAGMILFVFQWQAYLWPLLIAPSPDYHVASVAIAQFAGQLDVDYAQMLGGAALAALPPMIVLLFLQRYFTSSIAATGGKE